MVAMPSSSARPRYRRDRIGSRPGNDSAFAASGLIWPLFVLVMTFNIALPKGGIRLYDFPITWGYLLIGIVGGLSALNALRSRNLAVAPMVQAFILFLPLAAIVYFKAEHYSLPPTSWVQYVVLFGIFPGLIIVAMSSQLERIRTKDIARALRPMVRFAVVWGLMNFVLFALTREIIEIPFLTVNASEVGMTLSKNNLRGGLMKLVSTYNNGNIFGVCMVMLMPLYFYIESKNLWRSLFVLAIFCTLSRTAWFSMTATFILMVLSGQIRINRSSVWISAAAAFGVLLVILPSLGWSSANLIDDDLGGRLSYLQGLELSFFGGDRVAIPEVVYFGLLQSFGLLGFVLAIAALCYGIGYGVFHWLELSQVRRAAVVGALSYLAASVMDGAIMFPPVFPIFLFLNALIYRTGYRRPDGTGLRRSALPMRPADPHARAHPA